MKNLVIITELATGGDTRYLPVPCRGNVHSVRVVSDLQMDANGTLTVSQGGTAVNKVTVPTGNVAAGTTLDGVPDATNKALVFDPDSATAANRAIKLVTDGTFHGGAATTTILIKYDDAAYVKQEASEA